MKLSQLKRAVDLSFKTQKDPDNIEVVITTRTPYITCGQLPYTDIACVGMGFDWEAGQFRITPQEDLMKVKHDVPQKVLKWLDIYYCPKCEYMLGTNRYENTRYCSRCGQAVKWE